ncbi:MAG: hypothetical protein ACM3NI_10155 [Bacteroidota bacterium]
MKSHLLPLAAVAGTLITLSLTAITLAAPADGAESPAATQVRQMEHQSRLREWSQGLGVDLSGRGGTVAQAETGRDVFPASTPASGSATSAPDWPGTMMPIATTTSVITRGYGGHEDDDADDSRS